MTLFLACRCVLNGDRHVVLDSPRDHAVSNLGGDMDLFGAAEQPDSDALPAGAVVGSYVKPSP